ncbi:MAG TPA: 50S ribosomal protein L23 [Chloroflexia bacterium]|nr:50S ribosomal protein L23 [Chloroflexia bacterium]
MPHIYEVIRRPVMTERNTDLMQQGRYTFEVAPDANKIQIKEAVERAFDVEVLAVNTLNVHRKKRRERTRFRGYRAGWKKAIVTLAPGQRIEIFEGI